MVFRFCDNCNLFVFLTWVYVCDALFCGFGVCTCFTFGCLMFGFGGAVGLVVSFNFGCWIACLVWILRGFVTLFVWLVLWIALFAACIVCLINVGDHCVLCLLFDFCVMFSFVREPLVFVHWELVCGFNLVVFVMCLFCG